MHRLRPFTVAPVVLALTMALSMTFSTSAGASTCSTLATINPIGALTLPPGSSPTAVASATVKINKEAATAQRYAATLRALAPHLGIYASSARRVATDFTRLYKSAHALYNTVRSLAADPNSAPISSRVTDLVLKTNSFAITATFEYATLRMKDRACN